jgi:DNA-binding MarR family transcriptional regulator
MDHLRTLGALVLDHRFRRLTELLLRTADELYESENIPFRARWASTYHLLRDKGPMAVGEIADNLRLTHPAVIGITNDMAEAGLVTTVRDREDARRRLVALSAAGRRLSPTLAKLWEAFANAQSERFTAAGCDIVAALDRVDDSFRERPLVEDVRARLGTASTTGRRGRARAAVAVAFGALLLGGFGARAAGAQADFGPAPVSSLVGAIADSLVQGYIYEAKGRMIADTLRAELRAGAFRDVTSSAELAARINATMRRVSNDKHLGMRAAAPAGSGPQPMRRRVMGAGPSSEQQSFIRAEMRPDGIGYIDLRGFPEGPDALKAADEAMAAVAGARALIIDVGRNRGGGEEMVKYLSAYLFDRRTHLVSTYERGMPAALERWTSDHVAGRTMGRVPVYLLTSPNTFSAAESFAFGLKAKGRVTLVGERTGGGGHWGRVITLPGDYTMFLPVGRTFDPRTNEGWEATGIAPDIAVPYAEALAKVLALLATSS